MDCPSQDVQIISLHKFFPVTNLPTFHLILNFSNYETWPQSEQSLVYLLIDINKPRLKNRSSSIFRALKFNKDRLTCKISMKSLVGLCIHSGAILWYIFHIRIIFGESSWCTVWKQGRICFVIMTQQGPLCCRYSARTLITIEYCHCMLLFGTQVTAFPFYRNITNNHITVTSQKKRICNPLKQSTFTCALNALVAGSAPRLVSDAVRRCTQSRTRRAISYNFA